MHDVGSCLAQRADVGVETPPVMSAARPPNYACCGAASRSNPLDDVARNTDDRHFDAALERREKVRHTDVRAAALDVVRICDEPHSRERDRSLVL